MGWSTGSSLMRDIIKAVKVTSLPFFERKVLYTKLIDAFESQDWDTQDEATGLDKAFDAALQELYPDNEE